MTLSAQRKTRSYLQLLYIVGKLRYRRFTVLHVRSLGYCMERIRGDFLHAVSYSCNCDSCIVSLLLLSKSLHNTNKYLSISFSVHLGGWQCAEELLSALWNNATRNSVRKSHSQSCSHRVVIPGNFYFGRKVWITTKFLPLTPSKWENQWCYVMSAWILVTIGTHRER